ncbi:Rossmann-fold NAD(P)-binding domain-containing protein [Flavobacterium haoranii]|uniref:Nucleoside-diphosphate-sugar epimerase n=1 Tax=Flavobacterium haoranii TaxID=683124 RepID=A0A1M6F3A2_9FLAO|nr:NAD(P)H-binding protein [Flavobacterium haoranii]SHI92188.1 Nucleoside-diphosphate-sugar epimerase [Flavobacterium haoranii]
MNKKISILGCGWLGLPLAQQFVTKGYEVKGSTTSISKHHELKEQNIQPYIVELHENEVYGDFDQFLEGSELLVINFPPKLNGESPESLVKKIKKCLPFIEKSTVKKVIFVSSTAVFPDSFPMKTIYEDTPPQPNDERGKQLLESENRLRYNTHFETTILRFGGLIGEERHPINFIAGKKNIDNPEAPVNLIHQQDCINLIFHIIDHNLWGKALNATYPKHPKRNEYYTEKAATLGLEIPEFKTNTISKGKYISCKYLREKYGFEFLNEI